MSVAQPDASGGAEGADADAAEVSLLFVCLGNICRSPTAEGVMRSLVQQAGLDGEIEIDSAGTGAWHVGSAPDERASAAAAAQGVTLSGHARRVEPEDFERFDVIVAMDRANLRDLRSLARTADEREKVRLLLEFDPASASASDLDVPDPYYGGEDGFGTVFALVRAACEGMLEEIRGGRLP